MHSLETSLYFAPNSCQVVYMEPQSHYSSLIHLWPLPIGHCCRCRHHCRCCRHRRHGPGRCPCRFRRFSPLAWGLLPTAITAAAIFAALCWLLSALALATAAASAISATTAGSVFSTATAALLLRVIVMIVFVVTAAIVVVVIIVIVPVAVVDNNAMPSPCRSLCCRSLPSLLSQCFLGCHWRCLRHPTAAASAVDAVSVSAAAATYQPPWSWPVAPQKSILVKILLNRKSSLVKRHASMVRRREHLSAYLRICISGGQQNHKKIKKN